MSLQRTAVDITTGEVTIIDRKAYHNEDGVVVVLDAGEPAPAGFVEFIPEPELPRAPSVVTMRQARLALLQAGKLGDIEAAVAQLGAAAQIEWEYAQTVERNHPLVQALGMSEADLDALFTAAAAL